MPLSCFSIKLATPFKSWVLQTSLNYWASQYSIHRIPLSNAIAILFIVPISNTFFTSHHSRHTTDSPPSNWERERSVLRVRISLIIQRQRQRLASRKRKNLVRGCKRYLKTVWLKGLSTSLQMHSNRCLLLYWALNFAWDQIKLRVILTNRMSSKLSHLKTRNTQEKSTYLVMSICARKMTLPKKCRHVLHQSVIQIHKQHFVSPPELMTRNITTTSQRNARNVYDRSFNNTGF